jgi:hypothetical protein
LTINTPNMYVEVDYYYVWKGSFFLYFLNLGIIINARNPIEYKINP